MLKAAATALTSLIQQIQNSQFFDNLLNQLQNGIPQAIDIAFRAVKIFTDGFFALRKSTNEVSTVTLFLRDKILQLAEGYTRAKIAKARFFGEDTFVLEAELKSIERLRDGLLDTARTTIKANDDLTRSQEELTQLIEQGRNQTIAVYEKEKIAAEEQANAIESTNNRRAQSEKKTSETTINELKKINEARANLRLVEEAARLEELGNDQIFRDEKLIALQEYLTAEQEAQIQANLNLAQTEAERQAILIQAQADGIKARQDGKRKELEDLRKAEGEYTKFLQQQEQTRERNRRDSLSTIATLSQSNNKELAAIGKAAGITQIAIDTPVAVSKALAAFPPPFNFVAAAAVGAAMAAQAARLSGVNFEQGGIVPGTSFTGDNIAANVNSGEMILNRQQQSRLFSLANGAEAGSRPQEIVVNSTIMLNEEIVGEAVSRQVANGLVLGEVQ